LKNIKASFIKLSDYNLNDFPRIELQIIKTYVTFGWYQLKQGSVYLAEHFESNDGSEELLDKNTYEEETGEKIIACIFQQEI
jgi:hypothetical protein